jgi:ABC-type Na+ efflux pump permease subunit
VPDSFLVQFDETDQELINAIRAEFGTQAEFLQVKNFDAAVSDVVQVALPLIPSAIGFLKTYFAKRQTAQAARRVVVTKDGAVSMTGFSEKERRTILDQLRK